MNPGLIAFTIIASICTATFLVLMGFGIAEITKGSRNLGRCEIHDDCGYFEICVRTKCIPGCEGIQCEPNAICVNEFHDWRCECMPEYVRAYDGTCRLNTIVVKPRN